MSKMKSVLESLHDFDVPAADYEEWKAKFMAMSESDKLLNVVAPVAQYLLDPESYATASVMAVAIICVNRYISELEAEDF
ncbi:hypothetical protein [Cronobacter phage vB_Cdu_VP8]|nr:hypothetical protein [Serratia phage SP1]WDS61684.1 hypothetical protein [Cronobacter phage vB_Cdu_VP8]